MTTTLTARSPEDVLAVVPLVLGFGPTDSVVMLTFGGATPFHARVDLPEPGESVDEMVELLLEPALRHGVREVLFVIYSEDRLPSERVSRRLVRAFRSDGITVYDVLLADGQRWHPLLRARRGTPPGGVPYDVSAHPFLVSAVVEGRVTHQSREELAATLDSDPARVPGVEESRADSPVTAGWVQGVVARHVAGGSAPDDAEAAALLQALAVPDLRDAAWTPLRRETAHQHTAFWTDLVRRAPDDLVPHVAAVLGFAAWVAGHGALAWCAVDRAITADPDHSLAHLVGDLLSAAVPPTAWEEVFARQEPA